MRGKREGLRLEEELSMARLAKEFSTKVHVQGKHGS